MNVVIANKRQNDLANLDIDIIKSISGEFGVGELVEMFKSFFYSKMILDVTAIKDYTELETYENLSKGLVPDKIIFLLPEGSKLCTPNFLSHLIDLGIYNFTTDLNGVKYLLKKSNTLQDVEHIKKMVNTPAVEESNNNSNNIVTEDNSSGMIATSIKIDGNVTIIGFKDVTEHAGATTLIYMLKKELARTYGNDGVIAIELNKNDFMYFNDKKMFSVRENEVKTTINQNTNVKIVLVDLNNAVDNSYCEDIIYLIEPTTIKLNKLIQRNRIIFNNLVGKKVVLNKSALLNNDVSDFEGEASIKVFYNMPSLDERKRNEIISDFLVRLGLIGESSNANNSGGIFGLFRR